MTRHHTVLALPLSVLGVLGVLGVLAAALPADAATYTHRDDTGDAVLAVEEGAATPTLPDQLTADVVKTRTTYADGVLTLVSTTRAPMPTTGRSSVVWEVRTGGTRYEVGLSARGARTSTYLLERGADADCVGLTSAVRGARRTISVPAVCLGSPAAVRTGMTTYVRNSSGPGGFIDDAQRRGFRNISGPAAQGPRVAAD